MADIINFTGKNNRIHLDPDTVLETLKSQLVDVVVIGWKKDSGLAIATSEPKASEILYMLKVADRLVMDIVFRGEI